jgi:3-oxoacyl-[acyl-carrier protein] reductase
MDLGLQGARVLVTAASSGLGAAAARQFSLEGALVCITSRTLSDLQQTASAINAETGNPVYTFAGDVTDPTAVERLVRNAAETLGGLDVLITNAGGPPVGNFDEIDAAAWEKGIQLTLVSAVNLVRAALPYLRDSKRAAILAVTSHSAKQPIPNLLLSNSIRPAVVGMMKTLSQELGPQGIRVNSILPGYTSTDRVVEIFESRAERFSTGIDEERAKVADNIPLKRLGTPQEFANAAVFLCSPAAGFINGVALPVDGGEIRATL